MNNTLIIRNATICTPLGNSARKGAEMANVTVIRNGAVVAVDGVIQYVGTDSGVGLFLVKNGLSGSITSVDARGKVLVPGFVDSHTHLIFGGFRPDEFSWRLKGESYMSIMERGGGIQSTVNATRAESRENLVKNALWFIDRMSHQGVTTVEAKSGYGLDFENEKKMLEAIAELKDPEGPNSQVRVVSTFLGAHAVPKEYAGRTSEYVDLIIRDMLPTFRDMAEFCDIFTEKNVFEIEDSRRLMQAAKDMGYRLKFHADEIVQLGGAELAGELGAVSADHLLHISDAGIRKMVEAGTVATLLPPTAFALKEPYAPARKIIDAGGAVALATDLNPGSCFSGSIPLTISLACIYMGMSVEETLTALTLNGAAAVGMADRIGSIEVGKLADFSLLHFDNLNFLPYYVAGNCVETVWKGGEIVADNNHR